MEKIATFFFIRRAAVLLVTLAWSSLAFCGEIQEAAIKGDLAKLKALLKDNPALVSNKDEHGWTPLYVAASQGYGGIFGFFEGRKDVAELLIASGADVNAKDDNGETPLSAAADSGLKDVAELLLANKADVNARNTKGETALFKAAARGHEDVAELLLANKADVNAKTTDGSTPLHEAVEQGNTNVTQLLLEKGADVNSTNNYGYSPLHFAASFPGRKEVTELLLTKNADVNAMDTSGQTPLHIAAGGGIKDVVELLLANKADVNAKDKSGETPMHYAARGANGWNGMYTEEHIGTLELLLANKAEMNPENNNGETPLHIAVADDHKDVAEWLRQHGGLDKTGRKPLVNLKGLEGFQMPSGAILITSGFPYDKEMEIPNGYGITVGDSGDIEKLLFDQILSQEQFSPDGKYVSHLANTAVGISWSFKKAQTSFRVGDYVYTSLREGSTVLFTKEGVYLTDFRITPLSAYKKK